jgi:hypothetical protein
VTRQHSAIECTLREAMEEAHASGALSFELGLRTISRPTSVQETFSTKNLVVVSQLLKRVGIATH